MNYQVIYFSKKGNTKKIAEAIASELNVSAEDVNGAKLNENCFVLLGSGCYGGKPAKAMITFIEDNDFKSRNIALFGTSGAGKGVELIEMEKILNNKDACIKEKFFCKGKFLFANRGRPNNEDLEKAKEFAKNIK